MARASVCVEKPRYVWSRLNEMLDLDIDWTVLMGSTWRYIATATHMALVFRYDEDDNPDAPWAFAVIERPAYHEYVERKELGWDDGVIPTLSFERGFVLMRDAQIYAEEAMFGRDGVTAVTS